MSKTKEVKNVLTLKQSIGFIKDVIETNNHLQSVGMKPNAIVLEGPHGIGKTDVLGQIAKDINYKLIVVNGGQFTDQSDVTGYPERKIEICYKSPDGGIDVCEYVDSRTIDQYHGYVPTGNSKMEYAVPFWLKNLTDNSVLYLDDLTRGSVQVMQAFMDIILNQRVMGFEFPKGVTVVISTNPEDGEGDDNYQVTSLDPAQTSRMLKLRVKQDAQDWAEWAIKSKLPDVFVDFVLKNKELLNDRSKRLSARELTMFVTAIIRKISKLEDPQTQVDVINYAEAATGSSDLGTAFIAFVNAGLNKLYTTHQLLNSPLQEVLNHIAEYKSDDSIKAIFAFRIMNHVLQHGATEQEMTRIIHLCEKSKTTKDYFRKDHLTMLLSRLNSGNPTFSKLLFEKNYSLATEIMLG